MLPNFNFNPNFANLAALHGLTGGMPHPIGLPVGVAPHTYGGPMPGPAQGWGGRPPMADGGAPIYSGLPGQTTVPMQSPGMPQGNFGNLRALMMLLGQQ